MKCYIMFCVANLRKNMMTLFKIYHRHYLSSIIVNLLQLRHVSHYKSAFDNVNLQLTQQQYHTVTTSVTASGNNLCKQRRHSYADCKSSPASI